MNTIKSVFSWTVASMLLLVACDKGADVDPELEPEERAEILFEGSWEREFEAGPGNLHKVYYHLYQDSIRYKLSGPVGQANYVLIRDKFLKEDNRFVGHTTDNQYYLIFVKDFTDKSMRLYKQEVADVKEALTIDVPKDDTEENHGWNEYTK